MYIDGEDITIAVLKLCLFASAVACFHHYFIGHNVVLLGVGMWFTICLIARA